MDNVGFTQRSNAGSFLAFLEATRLVEDGVLSNRGRLLLGGAEPDEYRSGMRLAIEDLLGADRAATLRSGSIPPERLTGYLQSQFGVGSKVVAKFYPGLRWLATEAEDQEILAICPPARNVPKVAGSTLSPSAAQTPAIKLTTTKRTGSGRTTVGEDPQLVDTERGSAEAAQLRSRGTDGTFVSTVLKSGVLNFNVDYRWPDRRINKSLRWLQMLERDETIPLEDSSEDELIDSDKL